MTIDNAVIYAVPTGLVSLVFTGVSALTIPKQSRSGTRSVGWLVDQFAGGLSLAFCILLGIIAVLFLVVGWFLRHEVAYAFALGDAVVFALIYIVRERS